MSDLQWNKILSIFRSKQSAYNTAVLAVGATSKDILVILISRHL